MSQTKQQQVGPKVRRSGRKTQGGKTTSARVGEHDRPLRVKLQDERGRPWSDFVLPADTASRLKRAAAMLGIDEARFIELAAMEKAIKEAARPTGKAPEPAIVVTNFQDWHEDEARLTPEEHGALKALAQARGLSMAKSVHRDALQGARASGLVFEPVEAAQQGGAAMDAAPERSYLEMVQRREAAVLAGGLPGCMDLNLPGLGLSQWDIGILLERLTASIYFDQPGDLIRELVLRRCGSAWVMVELAELLSIAAELHDGGHDEAKDAHGFRTFALENWYGVSSQRKLKDGCLLVHTAFVVSWHTQAICRDVLPKVASLVDAAQLAEGLVIAETVVRTAEKSTGCVAGTVAQPTMLERQAWQLAARLWLEWPQGKDFGGGGVSRAAELVGLEAGGKAVAPSGVAQSVAAITGKEIQP